jgi:type IV pilus assembly protein PilF
MFVSRVFASRGRAASGAWSCASIVLLAIGCGGGPSEEDLRRSQAEYDLGVGLMHEQNVAGAFQHLQESIRLDPDHAEAHLLLGNLYLFRNEHARAEHHLRESLRANVALEGAGRPALNAEANNSLGVLYIHMHRYEDAVGSLRDATGDLMNRTPHLAWGNLGWAYLEQRDYRQALEALEQAVRMQPRFCGAWFWIGEVHFALAEQNSAVAQERFQRAEEALTRALEIDDPACHALQDAWRLRGEVRGRLGRRAEAVADFERCVELGRETESGRACSSFLEDGPSASDGSRSGGMSSSGAHP